MKAPGSPADVKATGNFSGFSIQTLNIKENYYMSYLAKDDQDLARLVKEEENRLETTLNLIAAESHCPQSVNEVLGSVLTTKTIEGYPGNRFHAGCVNVDQVEDLAIERAKSLFGAEYANVQPHSGTSCNLAVYFSVLKVGDRVLSMSLPHGGHLSHGHKASITSKCFDFSHYRVNPETEQIDYDQIRKAALEFKPKMIVAGASSYPRLIDYEKVAEIAREVSAYFLVDMAHLGGLVAAKVIPSPVPHADFVTFTCYKTMMGGRGGVILCKEEFGKKIDRAVFPGCQGTSAVNMIAAKALIFKLAAKQSFIDIQKTILKNAEALSQAFKDLGYRIVTGGTDNHLVVIDVSQKGISGKQAENRLESVGIVMNRNVVPSDEDNPGKVSGIRLGSTALAAREMGPQDMKNLARLMDEAMMNDADETTSAKIKEQVIELCKAFPLKPEF